MKPSLFDERYSRAQRLGSGAMGEVYRVYDLETSKWLALKRLRREPTSAQMLKREFRSLQDITHRNLLEFYDLVVDGRDQFFTMELVDGVNVRSWLRGEQTSAGDEALDTTATTVDNSGASGLDETADPHSQQRSQSTARYPLPGWVPQPTLPGPPDGAIQAGSWPSMAFDDALMGRVGSVLRQLVSGLSVLHDAGRLHRDLKPSNILVDRQGRLVVLDFGLVEFFSDAEGKGDERWQSIAGTPAYMSPEQASQVALTPASDWFSVGVLLYEALTGRLPVSGPPLQLMLTRSTMKPVPVQTLCPELPQSLAQLVMDLLRIDPNERAGRDEVLRWVDEQTLGPLQAPLARSAARLTSGLFPVIQQAPFVGRERELGVLAKAFEGCRQGEQAVVCVQGRSGLGKSELVREFLRQHRSDDTVTILRSRCHPQEMMPFKALDGVLDGLATLLGQKTLARRAVEAVGPEGIAALTCVFPVMDTVPAFEALDGQAWLESQRPQDLQRRAATALRRLMACVCAQRRLILWIDDLQWGDMDSARIMRELFLPGSALSCLWLLSFRSEDRQQSAMLQALLDPPSPVLPPARCLELELEPLPAELSVQLARNLFEALKLDAHQDLQTLLMEAEGSPFWIRELVQNRALGVSSVADERPADHSLDALILDRLACLGPSARALMELVAFAVQPLPRDVLKGFGQDGLIDMLDVGRLRKLSLLRTSGQGPQERLHVYHDKIGEALARHSPHTNTVSRHTQLAMALVDRPDTEPHALLHHFEACGNLQKAAGWALKAATKARATLAFEQAAAFYRRALAFETLPAPRHELLEALGDVLASAGRGFEAAKMYEEALECAPDGAEGWRQGLVGRAAEQYLRAGHVERGARLMRQALAAVGISMPSSAASTLAAVLYQRTRLKVRGLKYELRQVEAVEPDKLARLDACWSASSSFSTIDPLLGHALAVLHLREALDLGEPSRLVRGLAFEAHFLATQGSGARKDKAEALLEQARTLAAQTGKPYDRAWTDMATGTVAYMWTQWTRSEAFVQKAIDTFRKECHGVSWEIASCESFINATLTRQGRLGDVARRMPGLLNDARERGDLMTELGLPLGVPNAIWLASDEPQKALDQANQALERWTLKDTSLAHYLHLLAVAQASLYVRGSAPQALELCQSRMPKLRRAGFMQLESPRAELIELHGRLCAAVAHAESKSRASMTRAARRAAARLRKEPSDWSMPLGAALEASVQCLGGDLQATQSCLREAIEGFEALDMHLHAASGRLWLGQLQGDGAGREMAAQARTWMRQQEIAAPDKMAAVFMPLYDGDSA